jgi:hypothetical protein
VANGTKLRLRLKAEGSRLCERVKEFRKAKVFGEIVFMMAEGRERIWNKTRRRKRKRNTTTTFGALRALGSFTEDCLLPFAHGLLPIIDWMAHRIRMTRMPSSITEKAHSSTDPKKIGVKMNRKIRMRLMALLYIGF